MTAPLLLELLMKYRNFTYEQFLLENHQGNWNNTIVYVFYIYMHTFSKKKVGPTGVYLLDFFCSGIQFNLLLSPYPCFISLLYLDLYVLGDDALIS